MRRSFLRSHWKYCFLTGGNQVQAWGYYLRVKWLLEIGRSDHVYVCLGERARRRSESKSWFLYRDYYLLWYHSKYQVVSWECFVPIFQGPTGAKTFSSTQFPVRSHWLGVSDTSSSSATAWDSTRILLEYQRHRLEHYDSLRQHLHLALLSQNHISEPHSFSFERGKVHLSANLEGRFIWPRMKGLGLAIALNSQSIR